jgi:DNA-binding HxlR family transcriptional regulator
MVRSCLRLRLEPESGMTAKHLSVAERASYRSLEDVVGCKWSAAVVGAISRGISRPGQLERYIPGISTKVLTERLRRLLAYGLVTRTDRSGASLHVEYHLTPIGRNLATVIEQLHSLQIEHARSTTAARDGDASDQQG